MKKIKAAIYARKSKLSDRGESVKNQIDMCANYLYNSFPDDEIETVIYEDEGFGGGTAERPELKRLLHDITTKRFDAVICYRLDRISRNVLDFSSILELLGKYGVSFISITERFDTTTPIGRAMVNIAAVFAQLERETIAERIRDNMKRLARTGRYIGSSPPTGFKSERIEYLDANGNKKKMHKLAPEPEGLKFVELVFEKYLEFESLAKVETYLMQRGYKNKNGNFTGTTGLRRILTNPAYVKADGPVFDYYTKIGAETVNMREEFIGKNGMLRYGMHDRSHGAYDPEKWLVVLARHEGIFDSGKWLSVQYLLERNKDRAPRAGSSKNALLTSKIKCGSCGGTMVIIYGANKKVHYYKCRNKIKSRKALCNIGNINGKSADEEVLKYLMELPENKEMIISLLKKRRKDIPDNENALTRDVSSLKKSIADREAEIKCLTAQLRKNEASVASKYIISDIEGLDRQLRELKKNLSDIEFKMDTVLSFSNEAEPAQSLLLDHKINYSKMSFEEAKKFIDRLIDRIIWDGKGFALRFR